jgi:hypothetical protein
VETVTILPHCPGFFFVVECGIDRGDNCDGYVDGREEVTAMDEDVIEILQSLLATFNGIHATLLQMQNQMMRIGNSLEDIEIDLQKIVPPAPPTDSH